MSTQITAIQCPKCLDIIYSRARHDMRSCSCGDISIDGGFEYCKVSFKHKVPIQFNLLIPTTKHELYMDWNYKVDKFGVIKICG